MSVQCLVLLAITWHIYRRKPETGPTNDSDTIEYLHERTSLPPGGAAVDKRNEENERCVRQFGKMLSLAVCYSATIGGTATLTGSPPNLVFAKIINRYNRPLV